MADAGVGHEPEGASEGELVSRASQGDGGAIDALLQRHLPDLGRFVARRAGGLVLSRESTSDLVQSVCRELLVGLEGGAFEYRGEPEFRAWLQAAALNKIRHRARHWEALRRDVGREAGSAAGAGEGLTPPEATPSQILERGEEAARALAALEGLSARDQEVIRWARMEGLGHREIAVRLGVTEANSRMLLSRALARLAMRLEGRVGHSDD